MKKLLLLLSLILLSSQVSLAAGYCPTNDEVQLKMRQFQMRSIKNLDTTVSLEQVEALNNEMMQYQASLVPNCVHYFQVTHNPTCNRLTTLATGYMLLDKNKQLVAKGEILNVVRPYQNACQAEYMTLELFLK
jgi:hypothetical protein